MSSLTFSLKAKDSIESLQPRLTVHPAECLRNRTCDYVRVKWVAVLTGAMNHWMPIQHDLSKYLPAYSNQTCVSLQFKH